MKRISTFCDKFLTKNLIFFSIPILISLLSFVYTNYSDNNNEYKIEKAELTRKFLDELQNRRIIEDRSKINLNYIEVYQNILNNFLRRKSFKENIVKNIANLKNDSTTIEKLRQHGSEISISLGENLMYSEDNFDFKIPNNKNYSHLLENEYLQNVELIQNVKNGSISETYLELDNKILIYLIATKLSAKDSINLFKHHDIKLQYENKKSDFFQKEIDNLEFNFKLWKIVYIVSFIIILSVITLLLYKAKIKNFFSSN